MKAIFSELRSYLKRFKQCWLRYVCLFVGLDLFNQVLVIPFFRWITTYVLRASAIPFISYQNVVTIITSHTLVFIVLLIELVLLLIVIYIQFAFMLIGVESIQLPFKELLHKTWLAIKRIRVGSVLLLAIYFIFIIPFADIVYRTPLLAKIQIPEFIIDYMTRSPLLLGILIVASILVLFFGVRWIYTLPLMVFEKNKTRNAMKKSWQMTKHWGWWQPIKYLLVFTLVSGIGLALFSFLVIMIQLGCDEYLKNFAEFTANLNLFLLQLAAVGMSIVSGVVTVLIVLKPLNLSTGSVQVSSKPSKKLLTIAGLACVMAICLAVTNNYFYLSGKNLKRPVIISHRGVSDKNGVQNTISALKKTAKLKPDYVEIDLHETKDKQFVVMHDENLEKLAGINKLPKDLTLKQLQKITLTEDGHKAKMASFDDYLKAAQKLNQKLLIEIKTTPQDSKKMLERFNKKYAKTILNNKYQVQSLDYRVIEGLHQINPKLFVLYIQPYNFIYPDGVADGYSMEYSTLNNDFIWQANMHHHPVYAWTVNDEDIMIKMMYDNVDGIITDDVETLKETISNFEDNQSYANKLSNYLIVLPTNGMVES